MQSPERQEKVTVRVDAATKEAYRDTLDEEGTSMSEDLRAHMEAVAGRETGGSRTHYPSDPDLRDLYEDLLDVMNEDLRVNVHVHGSVLAQERGIKIDHLHHEVKPLIKRGFVAREVGALGSKRANIAYRIKPPCADPEKWVYRQTIE